MQFSQLLTILRARARLIVAITACALALGALVTLATPKRYEAVASVMVDASGDPVWRAESAGGAGGDKLNNLVSTHLDILASPAVAMRVVDLLRLERDPRADDLLGGGALAWILHWKAAALDALGSLFGDAPPEQRSRKQWMAERLLANMSARTNRDSRMIRVLYVSADPKFSAAAANAFLEAYQETVLGLKVEPAKASSAWFGEQVRKLKLDLEEAEARLAKFQQAKGIVATDERMDLESARLAELSAQVSVAESASYESAAREHQIRDFIGGRSGSPPPEVAASPLVQQLRAGLAEREAKMGELAKRIGPNHPHYQAAANEVRQLRQQLDEAMRSAAQSALAGTGIAGQREQSLRAALERQRRRVLGLKEERNHLAALARDVENARRAYNTGVERMTQTRMESQVDHAGAPIVYRATAPTRPAGPSRTLNMAVAFAVGLALGIGAALFTETFNRYVRSPDDVVDIVGVPVLAVLAPKVRGRPRPHALERPTLYSLPRS